MMYVAVDDVKPTKSKDLPWTWENEASNIKTRQCLCCGLPGHYQKMLESYMADHGTDGLAIVVDDDGYLGDGHHRVVAALNLGITHLPVETKEDAQARWVRDHGYVDWHSRKAGDR